MTLRLIRERSARGTTLGVLFVDDAFFSFSLEDELRERAGQPVSRWKIPGETAIPAGRYRVVVTHSSRFGRRLPLLVGVPGFEGIRIHSGNRNSDTSGCVLLGSGRNGVTIEHSRAAVNELLARLEAAMSAGEEAWILIENPLSYEAA